MTAYLTWGTAVLGVIAAGGVADTVLGGEGKLKLLAFLRLFRLRLRRIDTMRPPMWSATSRRVLARRGWRRWARLSLLVYFLAVLYFLSPESWPRFEPGLFKIGAYAALATYLHGWLDWLLFRLSFHRALSEIARGHLTIRTTARLLALAVVFSATMGMILAALSTTLGNSSLVHGLQIAPLLLAAGSYLKALSEHWQLVAFGVATRVVPLVLGTVSLLMGMRRFLVHVLPLVSVAQLCGRGAKPGALEKDYKPFTKLGAIAGLLIALTKLAQVGVTG